MAARWAHNPKVDGSIPSSVTHSKIKNTMSVSRTADVITEKPMIIRFGLLYFVLKPMTMAQIYEVGALVEKTDGIDLQGEFNPIVEMLSRYQDVKTCSQVAIIMLFRSRVMRKLFGWYVRHHMTMSRYKKIIEFGAITFQAGFFLTSFSFLRGAKETTRMTNIAAATALGDSSAV